MKQVLDREDLERRSPTWYVFEGDKHGVIGVSLHLSDGIAPEEGPRRTVIPMKRSLWSMKVKPSIP